MIGDKNDKAIIECYRNLAQTIVVSCVNDYAGWLVQQYLFPNGAEDMRKKAEETGKNYKSLYSTYLHAQEKGNIAYKFLKSDVYVGIFTSFTSDELISFAKRKAKAMIADGTYEKRTQIRTRND